MRQADFLMNWYLDYPPKRTVSMNADARMDILDAVGLAIASLAKKC
jgi:hypothetical protein